MSIETFLLYMHLAETKRSHGGKYPGEYVFLDILHPVVCNTFAFYLILVDAYSRYACMTFFIKLLNPCN